MAFGDIVLLHEQTPYGPYTRARIQEGLWRGEFSTLDLAHTPGLKDWLPLIEVLHYLDREMVHWPRARGDRMLPPLPNVPASTGAAVPINLPPVPGAASPAVAPVPPPSERFGQGEESGLPKESPKPPDSPVVPLEKDRELPGKPAQPPALAATGLSPLEPAPFMTRAFAFAIDCVVLFLPILAVFGLAYLVGSIRGSLEHRDPETARQEQALLWSQLRDLVLLVANGFAWIYAAGLESSRWQGTVGKQAMSLIVTDEAGARISFLRATGRHAAKYLSALPVFLGFMAALFGPQRLAWHDRLAKTRVVKRSNSFPR